jgi:hypothetical protein
MSAMITEDIPRIRTEVQVMFFDTDCAAVVHNIAYLRFIEIARTLLAEQLGMGLTQMADAQKYPVVVRSAIGCSSKAGWTASSASVSGARFGLCDQRMTY